MKSVYPVVFTKLDNGFMAYVPDMDINTQGDTLAEAIEMARDAIGIMGIDMQDDKKEIPTPSPIDKYKCSDGEIISLVDIDFTEYRLANERRTVRKNVSLPSWLNVEAEKAGLNFSAVLQTALKQQLNITTSLKTGDAKLHIREKMQPDNQSASSEKTPPRSSVPTA